MTMALEPVPCLTKMKKWEILVLISKWSLQQTTGMSLKYGMAYQTELCGHGITSIPIEHHNTILS
jgi:hypothetical protein